MSLLDELIQRSPAPENAFLSGRGGTLSLMDVAEKKAQCCGGRSGGVVRPGDVVALIGDCDAHSIACLLQLVDLGAIVMPLTQETAGQHAYFFEAGLADIVIQGSTLRRIRPHQAAHPLLDGLRARQHAGLMLFSSGSTGPPKAILHDFTRVLARYRTPRPAFRTLNFLLFDHIGGLNTLFHTLFNHGLVVRPTQRSVQAILDDIRDFAVELLPVTPTFLRMLLFSGIAGQDEIPDLKLITYGTERMDEPTLSALARLLPHVDIRQTYGMSELGILRVKTRARDQLWIQIGGEGVETKVRGEELYIRAAHRMEGYVNAASPFTEDGWYPTGDLVDVDQPWLRIKGRTGEVINVGGQKLLPCEVERAAMSFPGVYLAKAVGRANPVTGMHVELVVQTQKGHSIALAAFKTHLRAVLPPPAVPRRIRVQEIPIGHRFKRL